MSLHEIELDADDQARLRKLNDTQQGMQNFMQSMMRAGELRASALQAEGREVWEALSKKHNLDLENITWVPSKDGTKLLPAVIRMPHNVQT